TDDSLVKCIQEVRGALGADLRGCLETVPRRGYIFDAPVEVREVGYDDEPADASSADEPSADDRLADRVGDAASADSQIHVPGPAPEKFGDDPRARQAAVRRSSVARRSGFAALVVLGIAASVVGARFLLGGDGDGDVDPPTIAARPER